MIDVDDVLPWERYKRPADMVRAYFRLYPNATPDQACVDLELPADFVLRVRGAAPAKRRGGMVQAPITPRRSVAELRATFTPAVETAPPPRRAPDGCAETDDAGAPCAAVVPRRGARYCAPCLERLKEHNRRRNALHI